MKKYLLIALLGALVPLALGAGQVGCASGVPGPVCGNGQVEKGEGCDDGNTADGDGCNAACRVEFGFQCTGTGPSSCDPICGDGLVVGSEACDGTDLGGRTCASLNLGYGNLSCQEDCSFDPSGCTAYSCGNGVRDGAEDCEGSDLNGQSCASQGFDEGALGCSTDCVFDTSGCRSYVCGDGLVEGEEQCDDGNSSDLDGCGASCQVEAGWACEGEPSVCQRVCGNGVINPGEDCDTSELGGATCDSLGLGFVGGTLGCAANCTFNTSQCLSPDCGNGQLDQGEQCDGPLLGGATCESVGSYVGGQLSCQSNCVYNVSSCIPISCGDGIISAGEECDDNNHQGGDGCSIICTVETGWECSGTPSVCNRLCGNSQIDPGESCDGANLNGQSCLTQGYPGGDLGCTASCAFDFSQCTPPYCGDGLVTVSSGEQCDGGNLNGQDCQSLGFAGGSLGCLGNCTFDTSSCLVSICPNGIREGAEQCDGADFGGDDCGDYGFSAGSLSCTASCTVDTSGCSQCPATLTSVFAEAFSAPSTSTWSYGTDVSVSGSIWSGYTSAQHGVRIYSGRLEITNVRSGSPGHGQGYAYVKSGGSGSQYNNTLYNPVLASNSGQEVVWTLNMRRDNPEGTTGGFSCTSSSSQNDITVGLAYVLAGSSAAGLNASASTCSPSATAYGYAVVMGGSSGAIRLVRFTSGLRNGT
ncbi:MAG: DUF4215 domain-containing protein, partial [Polyangia bacterium]|nr:DUF4215 domain-containing protein [Polyangia bacterium]